MEAYHSCDSCLSCPTKVDQIKHALTSWTFLGASHSRTQAILITGVIQVLSDDFTVPLVISVVCRNGKECSRESITCNQWDTIAGSSRSSGHL